MKLVCYDYVIFIHVQAFCFKHFLLHVVTKKNSYLVTALLLVEAPSVPCYTLLHTNKPMFWACLRCISALIVLSQFMLECVFLKFHCVFTIAHCRISTTCASSNIRRLAGVHRRNANTGICTLVFCTLYFILLGYCVTFSDAFLRTSTKPERCSRMLWLTRNRQWWIQFILMSRPWNFETKKFLKGFIFIFIVFTILLFDPQGDAHQQGTQVRDAVTSTSVQ